MGFSEDKDRSKRLLDDLSQRGLGQGSNVGESRIAPEDLLLGKLALERGLLTQQQLEESLREASVSTTKGSRQPLGKVLISRGYVQPEIVVELLEEQSRHAQGIPNIPRYEVQEKLGEGASAIVYRAWDRELKRMVALKALRKISSLSEVGRLRFQREAQAAASLSHPNVVSLYDAGELEGQSYLVMEWIDGRPLSKVFKEGRGGEKALISMLEKAARGVAAAHAKGIVHRDLKPDNILVTREDVPKVGDFGLAHLADPTVELTRTGASLGTPLYMAPEQAEGRSKEVSPRTDVYALGAMLYEVAVGRPPFTGETLPEIYEKIIHKSPPPPRQVKPAISVDLETIILKSIDKDPKQRYESAALLADELQRYQEGKPILARPLGPGARLGRRMSRHPIVSAALLVVLLAGALGLAWLLRPEKPMEFATLPFNRLWLGPEMWDIGGHQHKGTEGVVEDMPGVVGGWVYEGKGPLPAPWEYTIPLEKRLPAGTYHLFVKNFYIGKMEATIAGVTRPLSIRRYDWTPGATFETTTPSDKVVLRYFPREMVADTGKHQEASVILQAVFLTSDPLKVPIGPGEITTLKPD